MATSKQDLLHGVIWKQLVVFMIPLLLGNLFQQLYNTADSMIVGNFVGKEGLAAVGATSSLVFLVVGFFQGISTGSSVVVAQYFGAKNKEKLSDSVHTSIAISIIFGIVLTILGIYFAPHILKLMQTPDNVIKDSTIYLQIYFGSLLAVTVYNIATGILRAIGDSRRPLYFLIISSIVNVVLDLVFIINFGMGVAGAAWATLISQYLSAILVMLVLIKTQEDYQVNLKRVLDLDIELAKRIITIGLPAGIQSAILSFSNVIIQSQVNVFGDAAMAGNSITQKIDGFVLLPCHAFSLAITTFVGQNIGAGQYERAKKGGTICLWLATLSTLVLGAIAVFFRYPLIQSFNKDPEVMVYASNMLMVLASLYFFYVIPQILSCIIRGAGESVKPMVINIVCMVGVRLLWILVMLQVWSDIRVIYYSYPISWISAAFFMYLYYKKGHWLKASLHESL